MRPVRLQKQMKQPLSIDWMTAQQDQQLTEAIERDEARLRNFIRRRVADPRDVEDILQEVFYELIEAYRMMKPIEQAGAWMFRVARNRIIDLFRRKKPVMSTSDPVGVSDEGQPVLWEDLLPSPDAGPEAAYARGVLLEELENAIEELPEEQREVFIAHEIDGRSFKELAAETGISINTLLARKRYAVRHLRRRLQAVHNEFLGK
jgi:RNA polymerase sigma factor (sigma-70 family)